MMLGAVRAQGLTGCRSLTSSIRYRGRLLSTAATGCEARGRREGMRQPTLLPSAAAACAGCTRFTRHCVPPVLTSPCPCHRIKTTKEQWEANQAYNRANGRPFKPLGMLVRPWATQYSVDGFNAAVSWQCRQQG